TSSRGATSAPRCSSGRRFRTWPRRRRRWWSWRSCGSSRSGLRVRQVRVPELPHLADDREEGLALFRQLVLDARRALRIAAADEKALLLERAQPLRQRARAAAGAGVLELREAARPFGQVVDEQCRPLG